MPSDRSTPDRSSSSTREGWLRDFTLLLRLRGVDGVQIGHALARIETYCDDNGQEPKDAFGEPASYAATLRFRPQRAAHWTSKVVLPVLGLVIGVNLALAAALDWSGGAAITVGLLASMVVFVIFIALLISFLRPIVMRRSALAAWSGSGFLLMVGLPILLRSELTRVPSWLALGVGLFFMVVGVVAVRRIPNDPIAGPHHGDSTGSLPG